MKLSVLIGLVVLVAINVSKALADNDPNRNVSCVARQILVTEAQFKSCFLPVMPDRSHKPDDETQRRNKAKLLPCLQKENPKLINRDLDNAMDRCRPEGPIRRR
jgi:hypothetical protein